MTVPSAAGRTKRRFRVGPGLAGPVPRSVGSTVRSEGP